MVFSSVTFLFYFLPLVLAIYWLARTLAARNAVLLLASLIFYTWGEGYFVFLLLGSIAANHFFSVQISRASSAQKIWLCVGVVANVLFLIAFKYSGLITESLAGLGVPKINAHLPLGVSFFTFQAMSLLIDVYRGAPPARSVLKTGLYIAMFPQLIAGPIVRFNEIRKQIDQRYHSIDLFADGVRLFVLGLAQKVLIADVLSGPVDIAFAQDPSTLTAMAAWIAIICFSFQIFYDFAGYSNMAIGLGRMMGFQLPQNFNYPYSARSFREFWRRWHMTLSRWFRDYLYIPLGGSRLSSIKTYRNLLMVFVLCGMWHGAAWTFLLWGLWHGLFLIMERTLSGSFKRVLFGPIIGPVYVFLFVTLGWVLFRAPSIDYAIGFWRTLFGGQSGQWGVVDIGLVPSIWITLIIAIALAFDIGEKRLWPLAKSKIENQPFLSESAVWGPILVLFAVSVIFVSANTHQPFLYFRF